MSARIESVQRAGRLGVDGRLLGGGLVAVLAAGVIAGYAAATLTAQKPSSSVSRAPASAAAASSSGVYADRDSRLPSSTRLSSSVWGDRDSRLPYLAGSDKVNLDRGSAAHVTALQGLAGIDWGKVSASAAGDRDSRPPLAPFNQR